MKKTFTSVLVGVILTVNTFCAFALTPPPVYYFNTVKDLQEKFNETFTDERLSWLKISWL
ncbi:hypothetical protein FACS1894132_06990 [Clostridia bacterium]|nr:hypothetical protein FACS1894132_06990 [Clostridia bacterium]